MHAFHFSKNEHLTAQPTKGQSQRWQQGQQYQQQPGQGLK